MYKVNIGIEGIAPILFKRLTLETQKDIDSGKTGGKKSLAQKETEAAQLVYRNAKGLYIPSANIERAMLEGSTKASLKYGRKSLAPFLQALVFCDESEISLGIKEPDFVDERTGRIPPRTGGRVVIRRPGLKAGWKATFTISVMDDRIPLEHIKTAFQEAGILVGLCDFRPKFGRYIVTKFEPVK